MRVDPVGAPLFQELVKIQSVPLLDMGDIYMFIVIAVYQIIL
jgi:hypothetical protein